jgi:hypothetical protein
MFAYTGIVSRVVVSDWLVLVVAAPLLVLLHTVWSAFTDEDVRAAELRDASTRRACVAGQLLGLGALAWQVYSVGIGGAAVQHVLRLVRVGQLDAKGAPESDAAARDVGIVALSGANAWIWRNGAFSVLDMHEW